MPEFSSPGVRFRELRAGVPQIRGVTTSVGGMLGRCLRGPTNKAVRCTSFPQVQRIFGSYDPNSYLIDQAKAFFDNGGSELWLCRVLGSSGGTSNTKATKVLQNGTQNVLTVSAKGEGPDSNNMYVLTGKENNKLASAIPTAIAAGAVTSINLGAAIAAKLQVGDTISLTDSSNSNVRRFLVAGIAGSTINLANSVTVPVGGFSTGTTSVVNETFNFSIYYSGSLIYGPKTGLRTSPLSAKNYFGTILNVSDDEIPITVMDSLLVQDGTFDPRPVNTDTVNGDALAGGAAFTTFADADYIGVQATPTGFYCFDKNKRVRMLAVPGITGTVVGAVSKALVQYCEARRDMVAVIGCPAGTTVANALSFKSDAIGSSSYGILDFPWVKNLSPITNQIAIAPTEGFRMGRCAYTDVTLGVANAPAGEDMGKLVGTYGVEQILGDADKDLLYPSNINPIEDIADVGQCLMGSRTLESSEFNQIHVRRTFIYMEQSLLIGTRFVIFKPNTPATRAMVKRAADAFMEAEWQKGTLTGDTVDDAFTNICNGTNNPDAVVKAQQMFMDSSINVPQTVENLVINIQQDQRGTAKVAA